MSKPPPQPDDQRILTRQHGHVAHIVFNNPARHNAMSLSMWQGLTERLAAFAADDAVRIVVLSGAGGRAFVSGADISEFGERRGSPEAVAVYNRIADAAEAAVDAFPKPIVARIDGYCLGGGLGLAIGCDLRICSDRSSFGIPAGKLGLGYGYDGIAKLLRTVGPAAASEIFLTAARFRTEALRLGLVGRVVPADRLNAEVDALAETIAGNAPLTLAAFKAAKQAWAAGADPAELERIAGMIEACYASRDYAEGRQAFAERRAPVFRGD